MRLPALSAIACLLLGGCVTNTLSTQNAQVVSLGAAAAPARPAPAAGPVLTPTARLAAARTISTTKTTRAGAVLSLASPQALAPDCTSLGQVDAKVMLPPDHGTIHIEHGSAFSNFVPGDPPFACNARKSPATLITYRSEPGFSGEDTASVQVFFPDGRAPTLVFHISVR